MVVRLLLILVVALALGAPASDVSADVVTAVEHEVGESAGEVDEAQVVAGDAVLASEDHLVMRLEPAVQAPVPPFCLGVFRPPRATFV